MNHINLSSDSINALTYTQFIGFINQWNVPPGAYTTLSKWATFGRLDANSYVLEVACTTGFSLRELCALSNCQGEGIDICASSIEAAQINQRNSSRPHSATYSVADAYSFTPVKPPTHITIGASLRFLGDEQRFLTKCVSWFNEEGFILASPFYAEREIPQSLLDTSLSVFGIIPTHSAYKDVLWPYRSFELLYEDRNRLEIETDREIEQYCQATITRALNFYDITDQSIFDASFERLKRIRQTSNELRRYQAYSVCIFRYRKEIYPNRYTELF